MKVRVTVNGTTAWMEGQSIEYILEQCGYPVESVILLKDGSVVPEDDVSDNDAIELLPVASGG
ncbi:MAG: MoaD/ThiS family protein [Theionarchaea archaeon]|nr:MoaD/ThiS family protein [Theionarchaea archaeon]MBU6999550.1 MoaD/ThiS family protein [Theionarchaea archaeon]MBU7020286.1 MoaD/ThiS family protein [Theionarchaea archaeon]MBU7035169.1 MoaD/ThiS family protein [Theionarchaea archaeon]MBU7041401.1 MoaD/ThiS family protein [Theionarchaea archaeon]